jgi:hypothetical protein
VRTLGHSIALVALAAGPALADEPDCVTKRRIIYERARHARDHEEYERLLRAAPHCAPEQPHVTPPPPDRELDVVDDVLPAARGFAIAPPPALAPATEDPAPQPIADDPVLIEDDDLPDIRVVTPYEVHPPAPRPLVGKPPLSAGKVAAEMLVGALSGGVGILVGALAGYGVECGGGCSGEFAGLGGIVIGGYIGGTIGIGLGTSAIGHSDNQTGSTLAAIGGSFVGGLAGGLVGGITIAIGEKQSYDSFGRKLGDGLGTAIILVGPLAGAAVGFNLTRRYDVTPTVAVTHGGATVGIAGSF